MVAFLKHIAEFTLVPSNFLFLLAVVALIFLVFRARKIAITCLTLSVSGFFLFGYTSFSELLIAPLVTRFSPPVADNVEPPFGLIVLGGDVDELMAAHYGVPMQLNEGGEAVPIAALLAQRFPQARIIVSGGNASGFPPEPYREADGMRRLLIEFGVAPDRIAMDANPKNTIARVRNTLDLVGSDHGRTWWVLTPAHRMPRVIGAYRQAGFEPIAYPLDFRWQPPFDPFYSYRLVDGLGMTNEAVHEWLGLFVYKITGKIDTFFPGPEDAPVK